MWILLELVPPVWLGAFYRAVCVCDSLSTRGEPLCVLLRLHKMGGFSLSGMCALFSKLGSIKRVDFERFLQEDLLPVLPVGSVLVLDNAHIHYGGTIEEIVSKAGCSLLYLPPYSPDFSPIELAWSWIKGRVRGKEPRDDGARCLAIEAAKEALPAEFAASWFRKCGYLQT